MVRGFRRWPFWRAEKPTHRRLGTRPKDGYRIGQAAGDSGFTIHRKVAVSATYGVSIQRNQRAGRDQIPLMIKQVEKRNQNEFAVPLLGQ